MDYNSLNKTGEYNIAHCYNNKLKFSWRVGYLNSFKVPFHKILSNYKRIKNNFPVEKPGRYSLP